METVETSSSSRVLYSFEYSARRQERKTTAAYTRPWRFYKKTHARTRGRSTSCWIADVIPPRHSARITFVPLLSALVDEPTTPNPVTRKLSLNDLIHTNIAYIYKCRHEDKRLISRLDLVIAKRSFASRGLRIMRAAREREKERRRSRRGRSPRNSSSSEIGAHAADRRSSIWPRSD